MLILSFPLWIKKRFKKLSYALLDNVIFIFLIYCLNNNIFFIGFFGKLFILLSWSLYSYINGRYSLIRKKFFNIILFNFNSMIVFFISLFILDISLFEKKIFSENIIFLFILLVVGLSISEYFIKRLFSESEQIYNNFLYIGNEKDYIYFKKEFFSNSSLLRGFFNYKDIKKNNYKIDDRFDGILIDDNFYVDISKINKFKLPIYFLRKWFADNYEILPSFLLDDIQFENIKSKLKMRNIQFRIKRIFDIFISLILILITSPIILISSLLIFLEDRGSIFYSQERIGYLNKPFKITKLRTMYLDAEKDGASWASCNDSRITKVGNILRKTRIDELPQLLSVIKGDMSLIGPRPERDQFIKLLRQEIPYYDARSLVKPGLSGWAQVKYSYGASTAHAANKLGYELFYLKNFSLLLDFIIFFKTIRLVCNLRGSKPMGILNSEF